MQGTTDWLKSNDSQNSDSTFRQLVDGDWQSTRTSSYSTSSTDNNNQRGEGTYNDITSSIPRQGTASVANLSSSSTAQSLTRLYQDGVQIVVFGSGHDQSSSSNEWSMQGGGFLVAHEPGYNAGLERSRRRIAVHSEHKRWRNSKPRRLRSEVRQLCATACSGTNRWSESVTATLSIGATTSCGTSRCECGVPSGTGTTFDRRWFGGVQLIDRAKSQFWMSYGVDGWTGITMAAAVDGDCNSGDEWAFT